MVASIRALKQQLRYYSDIELMHEVLSTYSSQPTSTEHIASALEHFGGLRGVLRAPLSQLSLALSVAPEVLKKLYLVQEIVCRASLERLQRSQALTSVQLTRQFLLAALSDKPYEVFALLLLDSSHRVIEFYEISQGTLNRAVVYPREVVQVVLEYGAAAVILVHNHPSGQCEPSHADKVLTERLQEVLSLIEVKVLDHIVVGDTQICSFAERGWIR